MPKGQVKDQLKIVARQAKERRVSWVPKDDTSAKIQDPWAIANVKQLQQIVKDDSDGCMKMLSDLRFDRDQFLEVGISYQGLQDEYNTAIKDRDEAINDRDSALGQLDDSVANNESLTKQIHDLKQQNVAYRLDKVKNFLQPKNDENASESIPTSTSTSKSIKLPDPPMLTDGIDPSWDDWYCKMEEKLSANQDWYRTSASQVAYVGLRLGGKAAKATITRRIRGTTNPYTSYEEIMNDLAEIFEDSDRKGTAGRQFKALVQGTQPFMDFYSEFTYLANILGADEETCLRELRDKLRAGLQDAWDNYNGFTSMKIVKEYLRKLDNAQRAKYEDRMAKTSITKTTTSQNKKSGIIATKTRTVQTPESVVPAITKATTEFKEIICHKCGKVGHIMRDCTVREQTETGKKASQEAKLHALMLENKPIDIDNEDSSSDSGNE